MYQNKFLIASLLILIGMGAITVSCDKDKTYAKKAKLIVECSPEKDGGEDDEDPIVQGKVKKPSGLAIDSASVKTVAYNTNIIVASTYTNSTGDFTQKVDAGIYYFSVLVPGETVPFITDTIHVYKDKQVTIIVD